MMTTKRFLARNKDVAYGQRTSRRQAIFPNPSRTVRAYEGAATEATRYFYYQELRAGDTVLLRAGGLASDTEILLGVRGPYRDFEGTGQWQPVGQKGSPTDGPIVNEPLREIDFDHAGGGRSECVFRALDPGRYIFIIESDTVLSDNFGDYFEIVAPITPTSPDYVSASSALAVERGAAKLALLRRTASEESAELITEAILSLTSQDIVSFSYLDGWQGTLQAVVSTIDVYPQRGLAANYLQLLFFEARKPSAVTVHTDDSDFSLSIEAGAPVVDYKTRLRVEVTPNGSLEQALRSSPKGSVTVSWFLRTPSGGLVTPYMSLTEGSLPDTLVGPEQSWIDPLLADPSWTALENEYLWSESGEHEIVVLFAWRADGARGHHFIKQRVSVVERDQYLRAAANEAGVNHADKVLSVFEQPWLYQVHELGLETQQYASLLLDDPTIERDELALNGGQNWNDPDWHRSIAAPVRQGAATMEDCGGGKLSLRRDGHAVPAYYFVWTPSLGYYEQVQAAPDSVGTAASFGLQGVRDDVLVARASWDAAHSSHVAVDEFDFRTTVPGDYVVFAQPQAGGNAVIRYVKVSTAKVHDEAYQGYVHAESWRARYDRERFVQYRLAGPGEKNKTTKLLPLQVTHLASDGTLEVVPLFATQEQSAGQRRWVVYDLRPGQSDTVFHGADGATVYEQTAIPNTEETLAGAIHDFEQGNNLSEGYCRVEWNPRRLGLADLSDVPAAAVWTFDTFGKTNRQRLASGAAYGGLGGLALGLLATGAALPVTALWLFTAAALTGTVSSVASIIDNLEQDDIEERRMVVDIAALLASFVGALAGAGAASYQAFRTSLAQAPVRLAGRGGMVLMRARQVRGLAQLDYTMSLGELFVISEDSLHTIYEAGRSTEDVNERHRRIRIAITNLVTSAAFFAVGSGRNVDRESLAPPPTRTRGPGGPKPRGDNIERVVQRRLDGRLFARDGISFHDPRQGLSRNCHQMALFSGTAEYQDYLARLVRYDRENDQFIVTMQTEWDAQAGRWSTREVAIENRFWTFEGYPVRGDYGRDQSVWPIVLEEAYQRMSPLGGGRIEMFFRLPSFVSTDVPGLHGHVRDAHDRDQVMAMLLASCPGRVMIFGTGESVRSRHLVPLHAYTVLSFDLDSGLVRLRNPWGYRHPPPMTVDEITQNFEVLDEAHLLRDVAPGGRFPEGLLGSDLDWARIDFENAIVTAQLSGRDYSGYLDDLAAGSYLGAQGIDLTGQGFSASTEAAIRAGYKLDESVTGNDLEAALFQLLDSGTCSAIVFRTRQRIMGGLYNLPENGSGWSIAWGVRGGVFAGAAYGQPNTAFRLEAELFEWHILP